MIRIKGVSEALFASMDGNGRIHALFNNRDSCARHAFHYSTNSRSQSVREVRVIPCDVTTAAKAEG